ncbi:MAG: amidohydrolase family protein [Planctomycetota bacterium]|jgi:imidazolonepropionase-like amidohydrolase
MRRAEYVIAVGLLSLAVSSALGDEKSVFPKYAIKAGKILTMKPAADDSEAVEVINHGVILVSNAKIEAIGCAADVAVPEGYTVIDASDRWVTPGIVEAHTHIGTEGGFNDMVMPLNPELRIADCVNPEDIAVKKAITGGVTTIHTMPGSGTNLAGFSVIVKMDGSRPGHMTVRELGAMKMTQAYNPERRAGDLGYTRMGMSWMLRHVLQEAKEYTEAWQAYEQGKTTEKPQYKPELEKMRQAFEDKIPTIVHTYEGWGVMQTVRMFNDENKLEVIATHTAGGGYAVGKEAGKRERVHVNIGPRVLDFSWGAEHDGRVHGMGAEYYKRGVRNLSINTDSTGWWHYIAPQEELSFQAAMSARLGLDDVAAIKAITINAAKALGIDDRLGSLDVGKDADLVIKKGSLLDVTTPVDLVLINGRIAYRRKGVALVKRDKTPTADQTES